MDSIPSLWLQTWHQLGGVCNEFNNRKLIGNIAVILSGEYRHKSGSVMRTLPRFSEPGYNVQYSGTIQYLYYYVIWNLREIKWRNFQGLLCDQVTVTSMRTQLNSMLSRDVA